MKKRRVFLIRTFKPVGTGGPVPPLGPLIVASVLRKAFEGMEVGFADMGNEDLSADEIADRIAAFRPDVVGLSAMTCEAEVMAETAAASKRVRPNAAVIVGGPHASTAKETILKDPNIDLVVVGEGEETVVELLRKAGTYKINYGFETAVPRLQKLLKKDVNISRAREVFDKTSSLGIITGAYFMLGIPTETLEEMRTTIRFAESSGLDAAAFFKSTAYPGTSMYESLSGSAPRPSARFQDLHFYSAGRSHAAVPEVELNRMMLSAQRRFYLRPGRILRGLKKAPRKGAYLANLMSAALLILQGYFLQELKRLPSRGAISST